MPTHLKEGAEELRWVSVYNLNMAVGREQVSDKHWLYFPEPEYPFYRIGFPMNFSPALGRSGCSSMYVEMSHRPSEQHSHEELLSRARSGMERAGILRSEDEIVVADVKDLRYAYVYSIGRYGAWEHTSMEDAIGQGKQLAERLQARGAEAVSA
jgi:protoporphyrinogen oxidase